MSSAQVAAKLVKQLEEEDWRVLKAIETSVPLFESIPLRRIQKETGLHRDQLEFRLSRLNYLGLVMHSEYGYIMNTAGMDALALNHFAKNNQISGMGRSIGMGKESDVFEVLSDSGERMVIKFYRIGRISFRSTRKKRSYVGAENQHQWLTINVNAARKEGEGLTRAAQAGVTVPKFIAQNRHAVLMSEIDGDMLFKCTPDDVPEPKNLLESILENLRKACTLGKIVNADISEYNVLYDGVKPWIIDWPQFVTLEHPNAMELLKHDVEMVDSFFRKKFHIGVDLDIAVEYVLGKREKLVLIQI